MTAKRRLTAVVLLLLLGGAVYRASREAPTGPADGTGIEGQAEPAPAASLTFRIGALNIHGCKGSDGRRDLERVAECLDGLDFVALSEVHGPQPWQRQDQAEQLGRRLGAGWLFAPASRRWYCVEFGNGLLSRLPVTCWQRIPLTRNHDHSYRNAVLVGVEHRGRTIHVLLTHICRRSDEERQAQLRAVIALYLALAEPAILMGDLNSDAEDPQIRQLLSTAGVLDAVVEILGAKTPPRIDWIFVRGLRCRDAGILDNGASDHPLVWAELE